MRDAGRDIYDWSDREVVDRDSPISYNAIVSSIARPRFHPSECHVHAYQQLIQGLFEFVSLHCPARASRDGYVF